MSGLDTALLALALVAVLLGLSAGIVRLALGLLSVVAAAFCSTALAEGASRLLGRWVSSPELALLLAFVAVFGLVLALFSALAWCLRASLRKLGLALADRILGALVAVAAVGAAAAIASALLAELRPHSPMLRESVLFRHLAPLAREAGGRLPPVWQERGRRFIDRARGLPPKAASGSR